MKIVKTYQPHYVARCSDCGSESWPAQADRSAAAEVALEQGFEEIRGATYCLRCAERCRGEP